VAECHQNLDGASLRHPQGGQGDARPKAGDLVTVLYQGRFLDGKVFSEETNPAQAFRPA